MFLFFKYFCKFDFLFFKNITDKKYCDPQSGVRILYFFSIFDLNVVFVDFWLGNFIISLIIFRIFDFVMLYFFTGEDRFLLTKELNRRQQWFIKKFWESWISVYDNENFDKDQIVQDLSEWSIFDDKKMIIFKWYPADTLSDNKLLSWQIDFLDSLFEKFDTNTDNLIVFVSFKPDKRKKWFKLITKIAEKKEFKKMKGSDLENFVKDIVWVLPDWKSILTNDLVKLLIKKVWQNTGRLYFESLKIKNICLLKNKSATEKLINNVVFSTQTWDVFEMIDYIFTDPQKAINEIIWLKSNQENWNLVMWTLFWGVKNVLLCIDLYKNWKTSKEIIEILKLHPFVVAKLYKKMPDLAKKYDKLLYFLENLLELDFTIKIWKLSEDFFWLEIKKMILDLV